jgi:hypothetical protein
MLYVFFGLLEKEPEGWSLLAFYLSICHRNGSKLTIETYSACRLPCFVNTLLLKYCSTNGRRAGMPRRIGFKNV